MSYDEFGNPVRSSASTSAKSSASAKSTGRLALQSRSTHLIAQDQIQAYTEMKMKRHSAIAGVIAIVVFVVGMGTTYGILRVIGTKRLQKDVDNNMPCDKTDTKCNTQKKKLKDAVKTSFLALDLQFFIALLLTTIVAAGSYLIYVFLKKLRFSDEAQQAFADALDTKAKFGGISPFLKKN